MGIENEDEIDATEEKAKAIGKDLGVEDNKNPEDDIDFDIKEEDDERIGKSREDEAKETRKAEREKLSNREKRQLRKKKVNEKFNEKDAIIRAQQEQLDQLNRRMAEVDGRLSGINKAEVDKAISDTTAIYANAKQESLTAFNEGDGEKHLAAIEKMKAADDRYKQLQTLKQNLDRAPQQQPQTNSGPDRIVVNKAKEWAERNRWYNAGAGDTDSEVAKAISGTLVKEGFDPKSDDFWDELDERLEKYIPEKVNADEDDEEEVVIAKPRKRTSPPVTGSANRGDITGKRTITLPTSYVNTLKANGIWDDKPRLQKVLADRERIIREQQSAR